MMGDGAVKIHVMRLSCRGERVGQSEREVLPFAPSREGVSPRVSFYPGPYAVHRLNQSNKSAENLEMCEIRVNTHTLPRTKTLRVLIYSFLQRYARIGTLFSGAPVFAVLLCPRCGGERGNFEDTGRNSCSGRVVFGPGRDVVCSGAGWCVAADGGIGK